MAAEDMKGLIVTFILVGMFMFVLVNLGIQIGLANDSNQSIMDNQAMNSSFGRIEQNLEAAESTSTLGKTSFYSESSKDPEGELTSGATREEAKSEGNSIIAIFNTINSLFKTILLIHPAILASIAGLLSVTIGFFIWKLIKQGQ